MPDAAEDCQQILEPESTMSSNIESFRTSSEGESIASSTEANRPSWPIEKPEGTTSISIPSRIRKANAQSFAFPMYFLILFTYSQFIILSVPKLFEQAVNISALYFQIDPRIAWKPCKNRYWCQTTAGNR